MINSYLKGLHTVVLLSEPCFLTMREVATDFASKGKARREMADNARRFYELTILYTALTSIHAHVNEAIALLEQFYADGGDLHEYAVANRLRQIAEYGSDDESDWEADGVDATGAIKWKVALKDTPESLVHYTLHAELAPLFRDNDTRGEYIGSSGPEHFQRYSNCVANPSAFALRKALGPIGIEMQAIREQSDGSLALAPLPFGDLIAHEIQEDMHGEQVVAVFNATLALAQTVANLYHTMPTDCAACYQSMLVALLTIRDGAHPTTATLPKHP